MSEQWIEVDAIERRDDDKLYARIPAKPIPERNTLEDKLKEGSRLADELLGTKIHEAVSWGAVSRIAIADRLERFDEMANMLVKDAESKDKSSFIGYISKQLRQAISEP